MSFDVHQLNLFLLVGSAVIPLTYLVTRTIFEDEREALRLAAIVAALPQLMMTVCHIGNIATRFFPGQQLHWSPQEERFTGQHADEANRHLSRPYRGPFLIAELAILVSSRRAF